MTIAQQIVLHSNSKYDIVFKSHILSVKVGADMHKDWYYFEDESYIEVYEDYITVGDCE